MAQKENIATGLLLELYLLRCIQWLLCSQVSLMYKSVCWTTAISLTKFETFHVFLIRTTLRMAVIKHTPRSPSPRIRHTQNNPLSSSRTSQTTQQTPRTLIMTSFSSPSQALQTQSSTARSLIFSACQDAVTAELFHCCLY